jgi:hypothetical protein
MKASKLLKILVIGLLIVNLTLVAFIVFRKPPHPRHNGPRNEIIERLKLDEEQIKHYDALIKKHRNDINQVEGLILKNKNQLYSLLSSPQNPSIKDSLLNEIAELHVSIENIHFNHFSDIKSLCKEDQLPNFNELIKEIAELFTPSKKHPKP